MNAEHRHALRRCLTSIACAADKIGHQENAEIVRAVAVDDLPRWVEQPYGAQVWAELLGGLRTAQALASESGPLARPIRFALDAIEAADELLVAAAPRRVVYLRAARLPRAA